MTCALLLAPVVPSLAERYGAVLAAVRALRPGRLARVTEDERGLWLLLESALLEAQLSARMAAATPGAVPRTLADAHAMWSRVEAEAIAMLSAEAAGLAQSRSPLAAHVLDAQGRFAMAARAVGDLFDSLSREGAL